MTSQIEESYQQVFQTIKIMCKYMGGWMPEPYQPNSPYYSSL